MGRLMMIGNYLVNYTYNIIVVYCFFFFFQAEDGIRDSP